MNPLPLNQDVVFPLLQQLCLDMNKETNRKLSWIRAAVDVVDPGKISVSRPILVQVHQILVSKVSTVHGAERDKVLQILLYIVCLLVKSV